MNSIIKFNRKIVHSTMTHDNHNRACKKHSFQNVSMDMQSVIFAQEWRDSATHSTVSRTIYPFNTSHLVLLCYLINLRTVAKSRDPNKSSTLSSSRLSKDFNNTKTPRRSALHISKATYPTCASVSFSPVHWPCEYFHFLGGELDVIINTFHCESPCLDRFQVPPTCRTVQKSGVSTVRSPSTHSSVIPSLVRTSRTIFQSKEKKQNCETFFSLDLSAVNAWYERVQSFLVNAGYEHDMHIIVDAPYEHVQRIIVNAW